MIIGIVGKAGSGKDAVGKWFSSEMGFCRFAFADAIKKIATQYFLWDGLKDERGRKLLQDIGDVGLSYNRDVWIEALDEHIRWSMRDDTRIHNVVVTDVRLVSEADYVKINNGYLIRIEGRGGLEGEVATHPTETEMDSITADFTVTNDGSLGDLYEQLKRIHVDIYNREQ